MANSLKKRLLKQANNIQILEPNNIQDENEGINLGNSVSIQRFVSILCKKSIIIDEGTVIASGVVLVDHDHDVEAPFTNISKTGKVEGIRIGKFCWIGANAVILKGVELGDYCVVGAGAVVTKSFPEKSIIVGNPAKLLKTRNEGNNHNTNH